MSAQKHKRNKGTRKYRASGRVPINTVFADASAKALIKYRKDKGFSSEQEVIRIITDNFLIGQGYLPGERSNLV